MAKRPKFYDLLDEQAAFIGPPAPRVIPKFTAVDKRESVQKFYDDELALRMASETNPDSVKKSD